MWSAVSAEWLHVGILVFANLALLILCCRQLRDLQCRCTFHIHPQNSISIINYQLLVLHNLFLTMAALYAEQSLCVSRASVRPSVCLSQQDTIAANFAATRPAGDIDRLMHGTQHIVSTKSITSLNTFAVRLRRAIFARLSSCAIWSVAFRSCIFSALPGTATPLRHPLVSRS